MADYDSAEILASIKQRGMIPDASAWTDALILAELSREIETVMVPKLVKASSEFLVKTEDVELTSGTNEYRVNTRSVVNGLRSIERIGTDGRSYPVTEVPPERLSEIQASTQTGTPTLYYFQGPSLIVYPTPTPGCGSVRLRYQVKPNRVVTTSLVKIVSSVTATTVVLTATVGTFTAGVIVDFLNPLPPFDHRGVDATIASAASSTLTFAAGVIPSTLVAGDQVCVKRQAALVMLPVELHAAAICRAAAVVVKSMGDFQMAKSLVDEAEAKEEEVIALLSPRNKGASKTMVNSVWG